VIALITCLYDLAKRGSTEHRSVAWMLDNAGYVLSLDHELVIFTDPELEDMVRKARGDRPTKIVSLPFEKLLRADRAAAVTQGTLQQNARKTKVTPAYVQLMWSKYAMLELALEITSANHIGWIDLGITHVAKLPPEGVDVFADPPDAPRVHVLRCFSKQDVDRPDYWQNVQGHLAGGLIVGARERMRDLARDFWVAAHHAIRMNLSPLDEGLLSYVVGQRPGDFSYSYGDYEDIVRNHDQPRGGEDHRAWIVQDAQERGLPPVMGVISIPSMTGGSPAPVYCLSFDDHRRQRMATRFALTGVPVTFVDPTSIDVVKSVAINAAITSDMHISERFDFRVVTITLNHMKMLRRFLDETSAEYGVFCENDIHLRLSLKVDLPKMVEHCKQQALDILLLGYLLPYLEDAPGVHSYEADFWGAQMYMLSRAYAKRLVEEITLERALRRPSEPLSPDWTITKWGKRARVSPMLAIEEGEITDQSDAGQVDFHRRCFESQYDPALYTPLTKEIVMQDKRPLLGLVMIVKNEAARIEPVLASYRPYIDSYTILDTGSTDGTQELIKKALENIPGALHEEPFVDFATSRNRALELHGQATMFSIMPNGDVLEGGSALRTFLEAHRNDRAGAYRVRIAPGHYHHPLVMRCGGGWSYKWRTHECATGPNCGALIDGVTVHRDRGTRTGDEWKARWERDLVLLNKDRTDDPADPRPYFYLGQTHECLGQHAQALAFFERRAELGGYFDEVYEAKWRIAKMMENLKRPWAEIQQAYLEAYAFDPRRAEPLHAIADHWHGKDKHAITRIFARPAAELPKPPTDLFLDEEVYKWRAADLASISSFYTDHKADGRRFADQAVKACPHDERLRSNRAFYAQSMKELFGAEARAIGFTPEPGWLASNPSIYAGVGQLRCVVRTVNYQIVNGSYVTPPDDVVREEGPWKGWQVIRTRNFLLDLNSDLRTMRAVELVDKTGGARTNYPVHGFEDMRLFEWQGKWWATTTVCDFTEDGRREIALLEIADDGSVVRAEPLRGPWSDHAQKNWMPFVQNDVARVVYATSPSTIFELIDGKKPICLAPSNAPLGHGRLRGGSQGVRVDEGWVFIVHDVAFPGGGRMYLHRFVLLDEELKLVSMSDLFYFERLGIEFCAGLARVDGKLVASYAVNDGSARLGIFEWEAVKKSLRTDFVI